MHLSQMPLLSFQCQFHLHAVPAGTCCHHIPEGPSLPLFCLLVSSSLKPWGPATLRQLPSPPVPSLPLYVGAVVCILAYGSLVIWGGILSSRPDYPRSPVTVFCAMLEPSCSGAQLLLAILLFSSSSGCASVLPMGCLSP